MATIHGTFACRGQDGIYYGSPESAPWLSRPQPTSHARTRRFASVKAALA